MPTVTAIIINWNSGSQLAGCLRAFESIQMNSFTLESILVVDNASTDGSADGLETALEGLSVLRSERNLGFGAACNLAARRVQSDYLLILNPDVRLFEATLESLVGFAEQSEMRETAGAISVQLLDEAGGVQRQCARFPTPGRLAAQSLGLDRLLPALFPPHFMLEWAHDSTRPVDQVPGGFTFMRRDLYASLGGFDERFFMYYEDVDLNLRADQSGRPGWFFAGAQAVHSGQGTTDQIKARRLAFYLDSRVRYARKHFSPAGAWTVIFMTTFLEIWPRMLQKLFSGSLGDLGEVFNGFQLYWRGLAATLRRGL